MWCLLTGLYASISNLVLVEAGLFVVVLLLVDLALAVRALLKFLTRLHGVGQLPSISRQELPLLVREAGVPVVVLLLDDAALVVRAVLECLTRLHGVGQLPSISRQEAARRVRDLLSAIVPPHLDNMLVLLLVDLVGVGFVFFRQVFLDATRQLVAMVILPAQAGRRPVDLLQHVLARPRFRLLAKVLWRVVYRAMRSSRVLIGMARTDAGSYYISSIRIQRMHGGKRKQR